MLALKMMGLECIVDLQGGLKAWKWRGLRGVRYDSEVWSRLTHGGRE
jgi:hypothetical protein